MAGILRPGKAGANTAADHVEILTMALAALPAHARPSPDDRDAPQVMVRTDAAGATHAFAAAIRSAGCGFSLGFSIAADVQAAVLAIPEDVWVPAYDLDGRPRKGAWVAEITGMLDLSKWPPGSRVIIRRERPHPGAQLRLVPGVPPGYSPDDSADALAANAVTSATLATAAAVRPTTRCPIRDPPVLVFVCGLDTGPSRAAFISLADREVPPLLPALTNHGWLRAERSDTEVAVVGSTRRWCVATVDSAASTTSAD